MNSKIAAVISIESLTERYIGSCRRHGVRHNLAVFRALFKAKIKKSRHQMCNLVFFMSDLMDADFHPLLDVFVEIDSSEIDTVDMLLYDAPCKMEGEFVLLLLRAIRQKLRVVDLLDLSVGKGFLRDLSRRGLTCQVLNLRSSHFRKLHMKGEFLQLRKLNLDFSSSLTILGEDCFTCMPNLKFLSLCETRISNLWTTSAAISKLPSLLELRFQNCMYHYDTGPCAASFGEKRVDTKLPDSDFDNEVGSSDEITYNDLDAGEAHGSTVYFNEFFIHSEDEFGDSSDDSEGEFSNRGSELLEILLDVIPEWKGQIDLQDEGTSIGTSQMRADGSSSSSSNSRRIRPVVPKKYISYHPSPICYEKHYREYMIASLPRLKFLDDLYIREVDRKRANIIFSKHFEYLPYKRKKRESIVSVLQKREIRARGTHVETSTQKLPDDSGKSQDLYTRALSAAKVGSSPWPLLHILSISDKISGDEILSFRPRQFEYHPSDPSLMVFGTLDGEVVVINHENGNAVGYIPSLGAMNSVLGLCWLKKYPSKLIAGSDNGSLKLYDIHSSACSVTFDEFDQLTSVHVNSTDELFLASGYSKHVALYDINTGRRLNVFTDMHREHINVVKFANHHPSLFATSSFDRDIKMWDLRQKPIWPCYTASSSQGNVMVCFSPDDHYLLASAVDNEVKQLLAADGRVHLDLDLPSTGSSQNYTRSYYMNGRDYIISGSCDEHVVRICCAQTGRRLRDVSLEGKDSGASMFVQSLRGDPFRDFNMSILAAYISPNSNSEIVKVNLLAPNTYDKEEYSDSQLTPQCRIMGG